MSVDLSISSTSVQSQNLQLNTSERPDALKEMIQSTFQVLSAQQRSNWGVTNGKKKYKICAIDEHQLIFKIINNAPPEQKDFYVMDIGAGNFQWGQALMHFINDEKTKKLLPEDFTLHIINLRGEGYQGEKIVQEGNCRFYSLGAFKVEDLAAELEKEGIPSKNHMDLIVSSWTFKHLIDPAETLVEAYESLRPHRGYFLLDGFRLEVDTAPKTGLMCDRSNIARLLKDLNAEFITRESYPHTDFSYSEYAIKKLTDASSIVPFGYGEEIIKASSRMQAVTTYKRSICSLQPLEYPNESDIQRKELLPRNFFFGHQVLFDHFKEESLLPKDCLLNFRDVEAYDKALRMRRKLMAETKSE